MEGDSGDAAELIGGLGVPARPKAPSTSKFQGDKKMEAQAVNRFYAKTSGEEFDIEPFHKEAERA